MWCKHYRAMSEFHTCEAGVEYERFRGKLNDCPCFPNESKPLVVPHPLCDLVVYPTPEEQAAEREALLERFANIAIAAAAIEKACGGPWKPGSRGKRGEIACPVCKDGRLTFSRAGVNGHVAAGCSTPSCVRWMQ